MNYTTNYHLPQWVESDRIMMEDFNQMCVDIENGLNQATRTDCVIISTKGNTSGDTIYTFSEAPRFVLLRGKYDMTVLQADGTAQLLEYSAYFTDYIVTFQLTGMTLIMTERNKPAAAETLTIVAFY